MIFFDFENILKLVFLDYPESFLCLLFINIIFRFNLNFKKIGIVSVFSAVIINTLEINFTPNLSDANMKPWITILIIAAIFKITNIENVKIYKSLIASFLLFVIMGLIEFTMAVLMLVVLNMSISELMQHVWIRIALAIPIRIFQLIVILFIKDNMRVLSFNIKTFFTKDI